MVEMIVYEVFIKYYEKISKKRVKYCAVLYQYSKQTKKIINQKRKTQ